MYYQPIFVTGTDTGVGKTTVSCLLACGARSRRLRVGVLKPAETGCLDSPHGRLPQDAIKLQFFSATGSDLSTICPYALHDPLAPAVAARRQGVVIDPELLDRCFRAIDETHDISLVEGAGGLLVPLGNQLDFADLAARWHLRVLVIVGNRLGAINHALLTLRHARDRGLDVMGYIINHLSDADDLAASTNVETLRELAGPPLAVIPRLDTDLDLNESARQELMRIAERHIDLDAILGKPSAASGARPRR